MIRILVRQVIDFRHRTPKSLAVGDIESTFELGAFSRGAELDTHTARLYVELGDRDRPIACATFKPSVKAGENIWQFVLEAIAAGLKAKTGAKGAGKGCGKPGVCG